MSDIHPGAGVLMERIYARQRHIYDFTRKYYLLGRDDLVRDLVPPRGGAVLEIACGTGRNLIAIARRHPDVRCHGLDVSRSMLATARTSVARAGLSARVALAEADATNFDPAALFGRPVFDRVVIAFALSMIPAWREVLAAAADVLAPGGSLHVVDFGDQAGLPSVFSDALRAWLARFHVTPRPDLAEAAAGVGAKRGLSTRSRSLYRGYAVIAAIG